MVSSQAARKLLGAWYTPHRLVDKVVEVLIADFSGSFPDKVRVLDPACGDGRFLSAAATQLKALGIRAELTACDIDDQALHQITDQSVRKLHVDALSHDWLEETFDIVVGNPPYLSQMATATSRGGASQHGGGPYADTAAEFLALALRLADPTRGRVGLVLPQSILAARDAGPVRAIVGKVADLFWSSWEPSQRHFDASVNVCALGFRRPARGATGPSDWTRVVTDRLGLPRLDVVSLDTAGTLGDRSTLNANFRDEYYALVPAVSDTCDGPPLVTSGLIDSGICLWGSRSVRFAKQLFENPRVDLSKLTGRFPEWAARKLVPKVLVANQTKIIEAVADPQGQWLPGVPVTSVVATDPGEIWHTAAVLTSPIASAFAWQLSAGTGLSTTSVRLGPALLASVPWPRHSLRDGIDALRAGDVAGCGREVMTAYGIEDEPLLAWWTKHL